MNSSISGEPVRFSFPHPKGLPARRLTCGFLLSFRSFDHTEEASYNTCDHLIRDARGADFEMPLQFVSWLTSVLKHFFIRGMASMPMVYRSPRSD